MLSPGSSGHAEADEDVEPPGQDQHHLGAGVAVELRVRLGAGLVDELEEVDLGEGVRCQPLPPNSALDVDRIAHAPPHHVPGLRAGFLVARSRSVGVPDGLAVGPRDDRVVLREEGVDGNVESLREGEQRRDGGLRLTALDLADQAR